MRNQQRQKQWSRPQALIWFVLMTWVGLRFTETPAPPVLDAPEQISASLTQERGLADREVVRSQETSDAIVLSQAAPVTDPVEAARLQQCSEALWSLGALGRAGDCDDAAVSERIRDAGMACSGTREPEDLGPGSVCESTRRTMQAFLQMLPAYRNPRLIGDPAYPADRFFTGVTEYLQMISPEEQELLLEAGFAALHQLPDSRVSTENARNWAHYWQDRAPELASRFAAIEPTDTEKREFRFR
jgi:hypothetical protein